MLLEKQCASKHSNSYVYFPIKDISKARIKKLLLTWKIDAAIEHADTARPIPATQGYRNRARAILGADLGRNAALGYDIMGNIAIIDVGYAPKRKEAAIAAEIMGTHPAVRTVVAKAGAVSGRYRRRDYRYVAGERTFTALYKENDCRFKFDIRRSFFSNRLSYERSRVASLANDRENVMVMFAGVGPFAIEMARAHRCAKVVAIELNRRAWEAMCENILLNKTENVIPILGDVARESAKYEDFADRIVMPLPKSSMRFLDEALLVAKRQATVHLYAFGPAGSAFEDVAGEIMRHAKENGYSAKILFKRIVRSYSPKEIEVVVDYRISKR